VQAVRIILLGLVAAIAYGIGHDQITARVCVEYFTIAHPPIFATQSPTLLAFGWGALATWWVGLPLGVLLAAAARLGRWPKLAWKDLVGPTGVLLLIMGSLALVAGIVGYTLTRQGTVPMIRWYADLIPASRHPRFMADAWAHLASYSSGLLGGLALVIRTLRHRVGLSTGAV